MIQSSGPFVRTHITNNVEYIGDLEDGTSQKAPKGMMSRTVNDLKSMF